MCKIPLEKFCFVCGSYSFEKKVRAITEALKFAYLQYFGFPIGNLDNDWTPKSVCNTCSATLNKWAGGTEIALPFAIPMIWRNSIDHVSDCYFCLTNVVGGRHRKVTYPEVQSVSNPVPNLADALPPKCPLVHSIKRKRESTISNWSSTNEAEHKIRLMEQTKLNDLCRDLRLTKSDSELLASRLKRFLKRFFVIAVNGTRSFSRKMMTSAIALILVVYLLSSDKTTCRMSGGCS